MAKNSRKVRIYSALEVANICGVVNQTAINWIKNGYLEAFSTPGGQYRVYAADLLKFLKTRNMKIPDEIYEEVAATDRKILVVDDDKDLNNLVKMYFNRIIPKLDVIQAFDGYEAGRFISEMRPEIIVLDIDLPGVNGIDICKHIKQDDTLGNPYVVVITGMNNEDIRQKVLSIGADSFFEKPLDFEQLVNTIRDR